MRRSPCAWLVTVALAMSASVSVASAAPAAIDVALSATSGDPGDEIRLTVPDPSQVAGLLPLPVHLYPLTPWPAAPCDTAGSRVLGTLAEREGGEVSLTFRVPWVLRGTYYLVAQSNAGTCRQLGSGPQPVEFEVLQRGPVPIAMPELVTAGGRVGPVSPGCGSWDLDGSTQGGDQCGPYEYAPVAAAPTRLDPGGWVTLGLSPNWTYGQWRLTAIAERDIPPSLDPSQGQRPIASGRGGSRTIRVQLQGASGEWRLFLTYRAAGGRYAVNMDRPAVFTVDFRLPDTSTAPAPSNPPRQRLPPLILIAAGFGLLGLARLLDARGWMQGHACRAGDGPDTDRRAG